jgi:hypothetical protein
LIDSFLVQDYFCVYKQPTLGVIKEVMTQSMGLQCGINGC